MGDPFLVFVLVIVRKVAGGEMHCGAGTGS